MKHPVYRVLMKSKPYGDGDWVHLLNKFIWLGIAYNMHNCTEKSYLPNPQPQGSGDGAGRINLKKRKLSAKY